MAKQLTPTVETFPKDAYIIIEGERDTGKFFIVRDGKVRLSRSVRIVDEVASDILGPGDFFGVVSTMAGRRSRIETARALTNVAVICIDLEQFSQFIHAYNTVAVKIMLQFSKRMRHLSESLAQITLNKESGGNTDIIDTEHFFVIAEYYAKQDMVSSARYAYSQYIKHYPNGANAHTARERLMKITSTDSNPDFKTDQQRARIYAKNAMIFVEGEPGEEVFIIQSGSVKISKVAESGEMLLAILKPGDIFGEMALLDSNPRTASAIANEQCRLMVLNRTNFEQVLKSQPQIITRIISMLAERIWTAYKQLSNTKIPDPLGRMYDMLLINLEKKKVDLTSKGSYMFEFGVKELINMVGLSLNDMNELKDRLLQNRYITMTHDWITLQNVAEFSGQVTYYRKMQKVVI